MPLGTDPRDTARIQSRLWSPRILNPTIWVDAYEGLLPAATWKNKGSGADAVFSGTVGTYTPNGAANTTKGKPAITWSSAAGTGIGTITGTPATSSLLSLYQNGTPLFVVQAGAATLQNTFSGSFPTIGIHLFSWPNATLTSGVSRFMWYNGTLAAAAAGTTGASGGAGAVAFCGSCNGNGGGSLGRILAVGGGNTTIENTGTLNRQGIYSWNEMFAVDRELTVYERAQVEGYLAWKWGYVSRLPASHTFKNRPPEIGA